MSPSVLHSVLVLLLYLIHSGVTSHVSSILFAQLSHVYLSYILQRLILLVISHTLRYTLVYLFMIIWVFHTFVYIRYIRERQAYFSKFAFLHQCLLDTLGKNSWTVWNIRRKYLPHYMREAINGEKIKSSYVSIKREILRYCRLRQNVFPTNFPLNLSLLEAKEFLWQSKKSHKL